MSFGTNGWQGLKKKLPIRAITFALVALGSLFAVVTMYQHFTTTLVPPAKSYVISKEEAIKIALIQVNKELERDAAFLPNEQATAKLIHVTNRGIGFVADENSLSDMWLYSNDQRFLDVYEGHYVWHVDVGTFNSEGGRGYWYLIDANSGNVIGNDRNYATFKAP